MDQMEHIPDNYVLVALKKSSNTNKMGYDVDVKVTLPDEAKMTLLAEVALRVALKVQKKIEANL